MQSSLFAERARALTFDEQLKLKLSEEKHRLSPEQVSAMEQFMSFVDHVPGFWKRGMPVDPRNNVVAVRGRQQRTKSGRLEQIKDWIFGLNIVTNDGDIYYAKKGAGESPASNENFIQSRAELQNPASADTPAKGDVYSNVTTPITSSRHTITATYPKTNDTGDTDNTGDQVDAVSYAYAWTTSDFNDGGTTIKGGALHDNASPVSGTKLLTHFNFGAAFNKTSSDTLKVFVNHTMNGT